MNWQEHNWTDIIAGLEIKHKDYIAHAGIFRLRVFENSSNYWFGEVTVSNTYLGGTRNSHSSKELAQKEAEYLLREACEYALEKLDS